MSLALLFIFFCGVWSLAIIASAAGARARSPDGRAGTSIFPTLPLMPILFVGLAALIDRFVAPWGMRLTFALHLVGAALLAGSTVRSVLKIRAKHRAI